MVFHKELIYLKRVFKYVYCDILSDFLIDLFFKVTKLPNGLVVASVENNTPVFRVAAVVQAGAKYEPYESRGVITLLRVVSNLV